MAISLGVAKLCGWGVSESQSERCQIPAGNGGPALVRCDLIHGPVWCLVHQVSHWGHCTVPMWSITHGSWRPECKHCGYWRKQEKQGNRGRPFRSGTVENVRPFPYVLHLMGERRPYMKHDQAGEDGAVLDRLHYLDMSPSVLECLFLVPQTQNRSLHGSEVSLRRLLKGASALPWVLQAYPSPPPRV